MPKDSSRPEDCEALRARLQARAAELEAEIEARQQRQPARGEPHEVLDHGEEASNQSRAEVRGAEIERDMDELRAIALAQERLDAGSWGECVDCGVEIDRERLLAQPTALRCITCQEKFEQDQQRRSH